MVFSPFTCSSTTPVTLAPLTAGEPTLIWPPSWPTSNTLSNVTAAPLSADIWSMRTNSPSRTLYCRPRSLRIAYIVIHLADLLQHPLTAFPGGRNLDLAQRHHCIAANFKRNAP